MGKTCKETVKDAITFSSPERVPVWYFNQDQEMGDVMIYYPTLGMPGVEDEHLNEWGYKFENLDDGTMGHPTEPIYPDWAEAEKVKPPAFREEERFARLKEFDARCGDRYRIASLGTSGFSVYTFLRGFENSMMDFVLEEERAMTLMDKIMNFECDVIEHCAARGFDAFYFTDDWATQDSLMISPKLWRNLFKPRYAQQFQRIHDLGMQVWFHCCGNLLEIAEDFNEIGCDVLNISQPNVVDLQAVGKRLRGKQCFLMPISYQTVSLSGTPQDIYAEALRMHDALAVPEGGFIGYVEEYGCMGMSIENYRACGKAFAALSPA